MRARCGPRGPGTPAGAMRVRRARRAPLHGQKTYSRLSEATASGDQFAYAGGPGLALLRPSLFGRDRPRRRRHPATHRRQQKRSRTLHKPICIRRECALAATAPSDQQLELGSAENGIGRNRKTRMILDRNRHRAQTLGAEPNQIRRAGIEVEREIKASGGADLDGVSGLRRAS